MDILLTTIGAILGWIANHFYSRQGSKELKQLNDDLRRDNQELRTIVEKLPTEVAKTLTADDRHHLSVAELNDVLRKLVVRTEKRPLVQVTYSWRDGEPKDKPFTITNSGDDEARNIRITPIALRERQFTFDPIGQLMPGSTVTQEPDGGETVGLVFRTIIDALDEGITSRGRELKAVAPVDTQTLTRFGDMVEAEQRAIDEFSLVPVVVTYEDLHGSATTLRYQLNVTAFAKVTRVDLDFVREGD